MNSIGGGRYYLSISVGFSRSVVSNSLRPHESQHTRPPCPSPTPGVHPNIVHRVGDAIQPFHLLLSASPPALSLSQHQGLFQVAKVLKLQLQQSVLPMNIQSWVDWFELLAVQGTLKSLLQQHSSKESILRHSAFVIVQLSHPYMSTGKNTALTRWIFVSKGMSAF